MLQREFASQKALIAYAEQNGLVYTWQGEQAFAERQRQLSPEQYEIVEVRTSRGMNRAMLFSQAIIQAEWEANAPLREAMAIKRERLRALRAKRGGPRGSSPRY
jgi:hypothetical protein